MRWGCCLKHLDVFWVLDSAKVQIILVTKPDYSVSFSWLCCTKVRKAIYLHFQMFMWVFRIMLDLSFCRLLSIQVCYNKVPLWACLHRFHATMECWCLLFITVCINMYTYSVIIWYSLEIRTLFLTWLLSVYLHKISGNCGWPWFYPYKHH